MKEEKKDKSIILLSIISILTLLTLIAGATFAWFSANVTGNEEASSVIVETATLGITYNNNNEIKMENALPGATEAVTFTIAPEDNATIDQTYRINWLVDTFDFSNKTDLVFSLSGTTDGAGTVCSAVTEEAIPETIGSTEICSGTVKPGETHEYSLTVTFKETNTDQNSNQGRKFYGKIEVTADKISAL